MVFTLGPQIPSANKPTQPGSTRYQAPASSDIVGSFVNQELGQLTSQMPKTQVKRSADYGIGQNVARVAIDSNNPFAQSSRRQAQGALDWQKRMNALEATKMANQAKLRQQPGQARGGQPGAPVGQFSGSSMPQTAGGIRGQIVGAASTYVGRPYVLGGNDYRGIDCSGLVQQVYRRFGYNFPRLANQQAQAIPGVRTSVNNLKPGDIVVWPDPGGHIAIYAGNGYVIQAANPRQGVIRSHLSEQLNQKYYGIAMKFPGE